MFDTLNFIQTPASAETFFENGLGVCVRRSHIDPHLYMVTALRIEFGDETPDHGINAAMSLGIHQFEPMNRTDVGQIMSQIEAR